MTLSKLSRRDFLKGAGATGMVGALALGGAGVAFAEEGTASGEAAATANPYSQALGEDASLLPMRHAECPGPHGPVAFEDRTIGDDESYPPPTPRCSSSAPASAASWRVSKPPRRVRRSS